MLKKFVTILSGYQIRTGINPKPFGDARIVQMKDVDMESGFEPSKLESIDLAGKKEPVWLENGDVLFVGRGYRNFSVLVDQLQEKTVAAPQFFVLKADLKSVYPPYLSWYLNHRRAQKYFKQMSQSTSLPNITRRVLENCPFVLPPLEHQVKLGNLAGLEKRERYLSLQILEKRRQLIGQVMDESLRQFE